VKHNPLIKTLKTAHFMAGKNGILLDDSMKLRERIEQAGGKAELDIEERGWHVYQQMPGPMTRRKEETP